MTGVGRFKVAVGLPVKAPIFYLAFRDWASPLVLVLLDIVLSPILRIFIAVFLEHVSHALFGG